MADPQSPGGYIAQDGSYVPQSAIPGNQSASGAFSQNWLLMGEAALVGLAKTPAKLMKELNRSAVKAEARSVKAAARSAKAAAAKASREAATGEPSLLGRAKNALGDREYSKALKAADKAATSASRTTAAAEGVSGVEGVLRKTGWVAAAGLAAWDIGRGYEENGWKGAVVAGIDTGVVLGGAVAGGAVGGFVGGVAGGAAGSVVPVVGNAAGAVVGATVGEIGGAVEGGNLAQEYLEPFAHRIEGWFGLALPPSHAPKPAAPVASPNHAANPAAAAPAAAHPGVGVAPAVSARGSVAPAKPPTSHEPAGGTTPPAAPVAHASRRPRVALRAQQSRHVLPATSPGMYSPAESATDRLNDLSLRDAQIRNQGAKPDASLANLKAEARTGQKDWGVKAADRINHFYSVTAP